MACGSELVQVCETTTFEERRDALIAEINHAFDGVSRGYGITLHEAIALDDYASQGERMAARRRDRESSWQEVTDKDVLECQSALSFLDPEGFRYYIPVFMILGLRYLQVPRRDASHDAAGILHSASYHLLHFYPKSLRQSEPALFVDKYGFSNAQCRVIARFLRLIIDCEEWGADEVTLEAVERWEQFANVSSG
jgi:hypothetical protein